MLATFPYNDIASKIALALGVGLLVGLEREWAHKDVGVRTFAITALLGALSYLVQPALVFVTLGGAILLVGLLNVRSLIKNGSVEMTTSVALLVTVLLGALIGEGHYFTAITSAILMTLLLAWKVELARFAGGLSPEEIQSAVLLALLTFVVYPLLPNRFIDPWELVNPRQAWLIVVVVAGVGFFNYLMLRLYGTRGTFYTAFFGGLISSKATVAELSAVFAENEGRGSLEWRCFSLPAARCSCGTLSSWSFLRLNRRRSHSIRSAAWASRRRGCWHGGSAGRNKWRRWSSNCAYRRHCRFRAWRSLRGFS